MAITEGVSPPPLSIFWFISAGLSCAGLHNSRASPLSDLRGNATALDPHNLFKGRKAAN